MSHFTVIPVTFKGNSDLIYKTNTHTHTQMISHKVCVAYHIFTVHMPFYTQTPCGCITLELMQSQMISSSKPPTKPDSHGTGFRMELFMGSTCVCAHTAPTFYIHLHLPVRGWNDVIQHKLKVNWMFAYILAPVSCGLAYSVGGHTDNLHPVCFIYNPASVLIHKHT